MPKKSIILNRDINNLKKPKRNFVNIRGKRVSNESNAVKVSAMRQRLAKNKIAPATNETDIENIALDSLSFLGITLREDIEKNYSLLENNTQEDLLDNFNIINPNLKNVENELQEPSVKKFPSKDDPFYELDDGAPDFIKKQRQSLQKQDKKSVIKFTADLFELNSSFKNPKAKKIQQLAK